MTGKMKSIKQSVTIREILYYTAAGMLLATKGIGLDEGMLSFRLIMLVSCILLLTKMLLDEYDIREAIVVFLLSLWGVFTYVNTGSLGMFIYMILIVGMKNISLKRLFKVLGTIWCGCFFLTTTQAVFGGSKGVILIHDRFNLGPVVRESLGYTHPNVLHISYLVLMAFVLYNYEKKGKKLLKVIGILVLGDLFVFMYSLSTTGLIASVFYLMIHCYLLYRRKLTNVEKAGVIAFLPICIIVSLFLPFVGGDGLMFRIVNKLFNNRLLAIRFFFYNQGLSLWGGRNDKISGFSLDNSYASALVSYGIVCFIIIMAVYFFLMLYLLGNNCRKEIAILCAFFWCGISEPFLFNSSVKNITIFFVGYYLYSHLLKKGKKNRSYEKELTFFNKWDRAIVLKRIPELKRNSILQIIIIVLFLALIGVIYEVYTPEEKIKQVYADEQLCDLDAETIAFPDDGKAGTLVIGNPQKGEQVYYFTRSNGNLIIFQEKRHHMSELIYLAANVCLIILMIRIYKEKAKTDAYAEQED